MNEPDKTAEKQYKRIISNLPENGDLEIPLLRDFVSLPGAILRQRLERRYRRLCFIQSELRTLSQKSMATAPDNTEGTPKNLSFEDFVFSNTDFTRYSKITFEDFLFFVDGIKDFDNRFFRKNFGRTAAEISFVIKESYIKNDKFYSIKKANPLILSVMRTLETSLECVPLIQEEEILDELNLLYSYMKTQNTPSAGSNNDIQVTFSYEAISPFMDFLHRQLDGLCITHTNGDETKLFVNAEGKLHGTFMPQGKPWSLEL